MHVSITMSDIAREVGVSTPVVSKVLHGGSTSVRVSPATADRIRGVARRRGYRPNSAALAISRRRFQTVALLQSTTGVRSLLPPALLDGVHDALAEQGLHLVVAKLPDEQLVSEGFIPKVLRELCVDGLLINYNALIPARMIHLIREHRLPAIWINSKQPADCVYPDDFASARQATEHLLQRGHRRIGFIAFAGYGHYSLVDRQAGYETAMRGVGLAPRALTIALHDPVQRLQAAREWLAQSRRPTAIVAYSPESAWAAYYAAREELGWRLPEELALITFGAGPTQNGYACLDTMVLPEAQMGREAVAMLLQKIKRPAKALPPRPLASQLAPGGSVPGASVTSRTGAAGGKAQPAERTAMPPRLSRAQGVLVSAC